MLWWTQLPDLLQLAAPAAASGLPQEDAQACCAVHPTIKTIEQRVQDASEQAEEAGFRLGKKKEASQSPPNAKKEHWQSKACPGGVRRVAPLDLLATRN